MNLHQRIKQVIQYVLILFTHLLEVQVLSHRSKSLHIGLIRKQGRPIRTLYGLWKQIIIIRSQFLLANLYHFVLYNYPDKYMALIQRFSGQQFPKFGTLRAHVIVSFWDQVIIPKQAFRHFCKSHFSVQQFQMPNFLGISRKYLFRYFSSLLSYTGKMVQHSIWSTLYHTFCSI